MDEKDECKSVVYLKPCSICGRSFNKESLERHQAICERNKKSNKRKVFDSAFQRTKDIGQMPVKVEKKDRTKKINVKWKEPCEKNVKLEKSSIENGSIMNNGSPSNRNIPSGYIQCPVCLRCFNYKAADRHITWCREQQSRLPKSPPSFEALQRLKARINYRAPPPIKKSNFERLIKSAESCKSLSVPRTYSSPGSLHRNGILKQVTFQDEVAPRRHSCERSSFSRESSRNYEPFPRNSIKFKEKFPMRQSRYDTVSRRLENLLFQEKQTNMDDYDILMALKMQLAELELNERPLGNNNENTIFPIVSSSEIASTYRVANENKCQENGNGESFSSSQMSSSPRLPRFCYQCGTKYPVASAKYCCECGAKRLILSNENSS